MRVVYMDPSRPYARLRDTELTPDLLQRMSDNLHLPTEAIRIALENGSNVHLDAFVYRRAEEPIDTSNAGVICG